MIPLTNKSPFWSWSTSLFIVVVVIVVVTTVTVVHKFSMAPVQYLRLLLLIKIKNLTMENNFSFFSRLFLHSPPAAHKKYFTSLNQSGHAQNQSSMEEK